MLATAPATAPMFSLPPLQAPPALADPKVEQLRGMFPELDAEILESMLSFYAGDVEAAAMAILDVPGEDPAQQQQDVDESVARALQAEMDHEVARSVNAELQKELAAEAEAKRQQEPAVRAAKAVENAAGRAKSFLQRALSKKGANSSHGTRLLDGAADVSDGNGAAFDFTPLSVPAYVAPAMPAAQVQPYAVPYSEATDAAATTTAAPPATLMSEVSSDRSSDRYSARLQRARTANLSRSSIVTGGSPAVGTSPSATPPDTPLAAPLTATPHVPVGELI